MKKYIQLIILLIIANSYAQNPVPFDTIYSKQITATKAHLGQYGKVTLEIDDAGRDGLITKPLIVAEGFDPGIIISPEAENGMNTYRSFANSVNKANLLEFEQLITGSTIETTGDQEYDIIYINWDNGVDYLQKNAYALEEVIKWVNEQKVAAGSTTPNVVLGQSMGGVIARYALADMEGSNEVHDTRLFVSHDAPQQGANMPISAQYMFRHLTSIYNEFSTPFGIELISIPLLENSLLDQPATQQMVKNWVATNFDIFNPPHTNFYNELRNKGRQHSGGYPLDCRNVAISNGAECGIFQEFNPGDDLISFNSGTNINMGMSFLFSTAISFVSFAGFFGTGNEGLLGVGFVSLLPGRSKFRLDFNAKSLYYNPGNKIYKGRISYQKKLFSLFGWAPTITVDITNKEVTQPNNVLPFDTYGGGKYETSLFTGDIDMPDGAYIRDNFSFIPTASALDIGKGIVTLNDTDYRKQYVGAAPPIAPKNSPFENFITDYNSANPNASNSAHISFNSRNGLWLARELTEDSITSNCSFMCGTTEILGSEVICTNGTFTVPAGAVSYTWSIIGSSASKSSSGNTATLTRVGQLSGSVLLRVVINGGNCGTLTLDKNVWIGVPQFSSLQPVGNQNSYNPNEPSISYSQGSDACNQIRLKANFDSPNILEYQWEKITTDVTGGIMASSGHISLMPICNKNFIFKVRARNICGWSDWKELEWDMNRCTIDCSTTPPINGVVGNNFILSPNPVTNNNLLDIAIKNTSPWFYPPATIDPNTGLPIPPPLTIKKVNISIYGSSMNLLQSYTNKTVPTQLDISTLPQGSYLVIFEHFGLFENYTIIKG